MTARPLVTPRRVWNNAPLDDRKQPYYPEWYGDQMQFWGRWPQAGVEFLLQQVPTPPELAAHYLRQQPSV